MNERNKHENNVTVNHMQQDYSLKSGFLVELLGVEQIEIQAAITAVGDHPEKVERYLRDRLGLNDE